MDTNLLRRSGVPILIGLLMCLTVPARGGVILTKVKSEPFLGQPLQVCPGCGKEEGIHVPVCNGDHVKGHAYTWEHTVRIELTGGTTWNDISRVEIGYKDVLGDGPGDGTCGPDLCDSSHLKGFVVAGDKLASVRKVELDTTRTLENVLDYLNAMKDLGITNWRELPSTIELYSWLTNNAFKPQASPGGHDDHFMTVDVYDLSNNLLGGIALRGVDIIPEPTGLTLVIGVLAAAWAGGRRGVFA